MLSADDRTPANARRRQIGSATRTRSHTGSLWWRFSTGAARGPGRRVLRDPSISGMTSNSALDRRVRQLEHDRDALYRLVTNLREEMLNRFGRVDQRFDGVDQRFDRMDARLDRMDARLDGMDARLDGMDTRLDRIDQRLDGIDTRLDKIDQRLDSIDARFDKIDQRLDSMSTRFDRMDTRFDHMDQQFAEVLRRLPEPS